MLSLQQPVLRQPSVLPVQVLPVLFLLLVSQNVIKRRNNENQENQHNKYGTDSDDGVHAGLADQNAL